MNDRTSHQIALALTAVVLVALVALGLAKLDLAEVGHALARINGPWVAAGIALMVAAFLARGESWYAAIRAALPDRPIGRRAVTRALLIGIAGSTVAPGRLGEAARAWLIARRCRHARGTLATVIGTVLAQTLLNIVALAILAIVALSSRAIPGAHTEAVVVAVALPAGLVIALFAVPSDLASTGNLERGVLGRVIDFVRRQIYEVRHGLAVFLHLRPALHSTSFQLGAWALQWGTCYTVIRALGLEHQATPAAAAAVLLAVNVTAVLPVTPANVGVFQAACIAALTPFKVSAERGLAYGLILQAIEVVCALAMGLPSLLREGVSLAELRRQAQQSPGATPENPATAEEPG